MKDIHEQNAAYIEIETDNAEKAGYILDEILQIKQFRVISDGIKMCIRDSDYTVDYTDTGISDNGSVTLPVSRTKRRTE